MTGIGIGVGSGGGFVPTNLSGLVYWLRADKGTTVATGVSAWADQSSAANPSVVQATGAKQPTINASDAAYNHQKTLSFDSSKVQTLASAAWSSPLAVPRTVLVVGNFDGTTTNEWMVGGDGTGSNSEIFNNSDGNTVEAFAGAALTATVANGSPMVIVAVFNGATSKLFVSAKTAKATGTGGTHAMNLVVLGNYANAGAFPLNGKIAEFAIYNTALTDTDVSKLLSYAGTRYSIAIGG